jgi:hypothetical protein
MEGTMQEDKLEATKGTIYCLKACVTMVQHFLQQECCTAAPALLTLLVRIAIEAIIKATFCNLSAAVVNGPGWSLQNSR